jgi:hypothetical protein
VQRKQPAVIRISLHEISAACCMLHRSMDEFFSSRTFSIALT